MTAYLAIIHKLSINYSFPKNNKYQKRIFISDLLPSYFE